MRVAQGAGLTFACYSSLNAPASEFAQPHVECGLLADGHLFKHHADPKNAQAAAGMGVDHFSEQFAAVRTIGDAQSQFGPDGNI